MIKRDSCEDAGQLPEQDNSYRKSWVDRPFGL